MYDKKSIMTIFICSALVIAIWAAPTSSIADNTLATQIPEKSFLIAQAHEHSDSKKNGKATKDGDCHGGGMHGHMMMQHGHSYAHMIASHADALQLSDEQLGKIARLHMQDAKEHEKIKEKMHKSHHAFRKAKMQPGTEDATLRKLGKVYADAFTAMVEYHIKERKAVHDILTPDQMEKLKAMKMHHGMHRDGQDNGDHNH